MTSDPVNAPMLWGASPACCGARLLRVVGRVSCVLWGASPDPLRRGGKFQPNSALARRWWQAQHYHRARHALPPAVVRLSTTQDTRHAAHDAILLLQYDDVKIFPVRSSGRGVPADTGRRRALLVVGRVSCMLWGASPACCGARLLRVVGRVSCVTAPLFRGCARQHASGKSGDLRSAGWRLVVGRVS